VRPWVALALLSVSWLWGAPYLCPESWPLWIGSIALGTALLSGRPGLLPRRHRGLAAMLVLPAVWFFPWPYRAAPLLLAAGLGLQAVPERHGRVRSLGWGAVEGGTILLAQAMALTAYAHHTARSHELPGALAWLLGRIACLVGIDAAAHGDTVALHSMRELHRLGATWELLLDPATFCLLAGGLVLLGTTVVRQAPEGMRWTEWIRGARRFAAVVAVWLPIRAGLLMALYLHRALRADPAEPLTVMNQFLSPSVHLLMLAGPVLLACRFVRLGPPVSGDQAAEPVAELDGPVPAVFDRGRGSVALGLIGAGVAVLALVLQWDPVGSPKDGRVMVVERHSTWEPTDRPYDREHFGHDPSYSYTRMYDYCSQYFAMSRLMESDAIDFGKLSECDVLVVKTPTARYLPEEIRAIVRFVEGGGGLLLIGDHTNVFKSSSYLNEITRPFGFTFRHDLLFCVGSPYDQSVDRPAVPHPVVQHLPPMNYAVSCSVDPGQSWGRAVVQSTGLWSLPPDYHAENFHPQAEYRPEMRYGAFVQLWSTRYGRGRVLAFTDSTIFSNFCVFQPGKVELMVGMLDWLNHAGPFDRAAVRRPVLVLLVVVGLAMLVVGAARARGANAAWPLVLATGVLGATAGSGVVVLLHRGAMPRLEPARPMTRVVIDRTVSEAPLSLGADTQGGGRGYGLLEQWISRLDCYTTRQSGRQAFSGDALVVICPTRSVPEEFRRGLVDYVARGGRLLVIDSPDSSGSTANSLLWPFGLTASHASARGGRVASRSTGWPDLQVTSSCAIEGGETFLWIDDTPVAARTRYEQGAVMAVGFGSLLNDASMGSHWMLTPEVDLLRRADLDPALRARYDLLFVLIEGLLADAPLPEPQPTESGGTPTAEPTPP